MELLDLKMPDWAGRIDLDVLDLGDWNYCVFGQLYEDFLDGVEQIGCAVIDVPKFGFEVTELSDQDKDEEYAELTEEWAVQIRARLQQA
jgi:hypothetical protein